MFSPVQITDFLFRGPQPPPIDFEYLAAIGIRTVINLREEDNSEHAVVKALGMKPVHIPIEDWTVPTTEQVWEFIRTLEDPANRPVYVHCLGGVGRTGTLIACWRIFHGMPVSKALQLNEMEIPNYGFSLNAAQVRFVQEFRPYARE
jgi:protein-tyrosine phosphatase